MLQAEIPSLITDGHVALTEFAKASNSLNKALLSNNCVSPESVSDVLKYVQSLCELSTPSQTAVSREDIRDGIVNSQILPSLSNLFDALLEFRSPVHLKCFEDFLDTITFLSDLDLNAKSILVASMLRKMLVFVMNDGKLYPFSICMEVLKTVNALLEKCPYSIRKDHRSADQLINLAHLILTCGDYEMQVGLIEALYRLTHQEDRLEYASNWFTDQQLLQHFLGIRDAEFELDSRRFLNMANQSLGRKSLVYTLPCKSVFFNDRQLKKPVDQGYDEFWIDFNVGSKTISFFCEQPARSSYNAGLWDTVVIRQQYVEKYSVKDTEDGVLLEIQLLVQANELLSTSPQDFTGTHVFITFPDTSNVKQPMNLVFGKHSKASDATTPLLCNTFYYDEVEVNNGLPGASNLMARYLNDVASNYSMNSSQSKSTGKCSSQSKVRHASVPVTPFPVNGAISSPKKAKSLVNKPPVVNKENKPSDLNDSISCTKEKVKENINPSLDVTVKTFKSHSAVKVSKGILESVENKNPVSEKKLQETAKAVKTSVAVNAVKSSSTVKVSKGILGSAENKNNLLSTNIMQKTGNGTNSLSKNSEFHARPLNSGSQTLSDTPGNDEERVRLLESNVSEQETLSQQMQKFRDAVKSVEVGVFAKDRQKASDSPGLSTVTEESQSQKNSQQRQIVAVQDDAEIQLDSQVDVVKETQEICSSTRASNVPILEKYTKVPTVSTEQRQNSKNSTTSKKVTEEKSRPKSAASKNSKMQSSDSRCRKLAAQKLTSQRCSAKGVSMASKKCFLSPAAASRGRPRRKAALRKSYAEISTDESDRSRSISLEERKPRVTKEETPPEAKRLKANTNAASSDESETSEHFCSKHKTMTSVQHNNNRLPNATKNHANEFDNKVEGLVFEKVEKHIHTKPDSGRASKTNFLKEQHKANEPSKLESALTKNKQQSKSPSVTNRVPCYKRTMEDDLFGAQYHAQKTNPSKPTVVRKDTSAIYDFVESDAESFAGKTFPVKKSKREARGMPRTRKPRKENQVKQRRKTPLQKCKITCWSDSSTKSKKQFSWKNMEDTDVSGGSVSGQKSPFTLQNLSTKAIPDTLNKSGERKSSSDRKRKLFTESMLAQWSSQESLTTEATDLPVFDMKPKAKKSKVPKQAKTANAKKQTAINPKRKAKQKPFMSPLTPVTPAVQIPNHSSESETVTAPLKSCTTNKKEFNVLETGGVEGDANTCGEMIEECIPASAESSAKKRGIQSKPGKTRESVSAGTGKSNKTFVEAQTTLPEPDAPVCSSTSGDLLSTSAERNAKKRSAGQQPIAEITKKHAAKTKRDVKHFESSLNSPQIGDVSLTTLQSKTRKIKVNEKEDKDAEETEAHIAKHEEVKRKIGVCSPVAPETPVNTPQSETSMPSQRFYVSNRKDFSLAEVSDVQALVSEDENDDPAEDVNLVTGKTRINEADRTGGQTKIHLIHDENKAEEAKRTAITHEAVTPIISQPSKTSTPCEPFTKFTSEGRDISERHSTDELTLENVSDALSKSDKGKHERLPSHARNETHKINNFGSKKCEAETGTKNKLKKQRNVVTTRLDDASPEESLSDVKANQQSDACVSPLVKKKNRIEKNVPTNKKTEKLDKKKNNGSSKSAAHVKNGDGVKLNSRKSSKRVSEEQQKSIETSNDDDDEVIEDVVTPADDTPEENNAKEQHENVDSESPSLSFAQICTELVGQTKTSKPTPKSKNIFDATTSPGTESEVSCLATNKKEACKLPSRRHSGNAVHQESPALQRVKKQQSSFEIKLHNKRNESICDSPEKIREETIPTQDASFISPPSTLGLPDESTAKEKSLEINKSPLLDVSATQVPEPVDLLQDGVSPLSSVGHLNNSPGEHTAGECSGQEQHRLSNSFKEPYQQFEDDWKNRVRKRRHLMVDYNKKASHELSRLEEAATAKELAEDKIMSLILKLGETQQEHEKSMSDRVLKLKAMQHSLKIELDKLQAEHRKCQTKVGQSMKQVFLEAQLEVLENARKQKVEWINHVLHTAQMTML